LLLQLALWWNAKERAPHLRESPMQEGPSRREKQLVDGLQQVHEEEMNETEKESMLTVVAAVIVHSM
jgi:hypothetical protein